MIYSIVYVSSAAPSLTKNDIQDVFNFTIDWNLDNNISGFLVHKDSNFIQLLEGEEKIVKNLFERIKEDNRHKDIIPIIQEKFPHRSFDGYKSDFIIYDTNILLKELLSYLDYLKLLDDEKITKTVTTVEEILKVL